MDYKNQKAGLLVEVLIVLALLSLIMVAITQIYIRGTMVFNIVRQKSAIHQEAVNLTEGIISGLPGGEHGLAGAKDIQTAEGDNIIFVDKNSNIIRYYKTGANVYKTINAGADTDFFDFNDRVDVDSLEFRYYDKTDTQLAVPVAVPAQITKIKIIATIKGKDTSKPDLTLTVSIRPRNLM